MNKIPGGYILKARKIEESEIAHCSPCVRELWGWLIRNANHKEKQYDGFIIKRGQLFRSIKEMRQGLSWRVGYRKMTYSEDVMKTAMKTLRRLLMITSVKSPRGILITISNYDYYQNPNNYECPSEIPNENPINSPVTPQGDATINKNVKNVIKKEEDLKENTLSDFNAFWNAYPIKISRKKCEEKWKVLKPDKELLKKMLSAIQLQKEWRENARGEFRPEWKNPLTWLNQECWNDEIAESKPKREINYNAQHFGQNFDPGEAYEGEDVEEPEK